MEQQDLKTLLKTHLSKLPEKLQDAIMAGEVPEKLRSIAEKYKLHLDQGQELENETYLTMLGIDDIEDYKKNIEKKLSIDSEVAEKITSDVSTEIFLSIRALMQKPQSNEKEESPQKNAPEANHRPVVIDPNKQTYTADPYREPVE